MSGPRWSEAIRQRSLRSITGAVSPPDRHFYPIPANETCWFLAADFDKSTSREDVAAFLAGCKAHGVPAALERSRSGQGGHVWILFAEPVPAFLAPRLGGVSRHRGDGAKSCRQAALAI